MFIFTTKDIEEWKKNPDKNPITGFPIKTIKKRGIFHQIQKQIDINNELERNLHKTVTIPTDIVIHILGQKCTENQKHTDRIIQKSFCKPDISYSNLNVNLKGDGMVLDMSERKDTVSHLIFKYFINKSSCIIHDYQYMKKYNITSTFWKNIEPYCEFYFIMRNKENNDSNENNENQKRVSMRCSLAVKYKKELNNIISVEQLTHDLKMNDNHPLLKFYREGLRICFKIFEHIMDMNKTIKTFPFLDTIKIMNDFIQVKNDLRYWNIYIHPLSLLQLKFHEHHGIAIHKKRVQTVLNCYIMDRMINMKIA